MERLACTLALVATCTLWMGCPGSVAFTDLDEFGNVNSAVWLEQDTTGAVGDLNYHAFVLSPTPGLCRAYEDAYTEYETRLQALADAEDGEAQCEAWKSAYSALSDYLGKFTNDGNTMMTMVFSDDEAFGMEPADGEYGGDLEAVDRFDLSFTWYTDDYYDVIADNFVVTDGICIGDTYGGMLAATDLYGSDGGTATVTHKGDTKIGIEFEATLFDEEAEPAGDASGDFTASYCHISFDVPEGLAE
jgi:hypothetical protein